MVCYDNRHLKPPGPEKVWISSPPTHVPARRLLLDARDALVTLGNFNTRIMHYTTDTHSKLFVFTSSLLYIFFVLFGFLFLHHCWRKIKKIFLQLCFILKGQTKGKELHNFWMPQLFPPIFPPIQTLDAEVCPTWPLLGKTLFRLSIQGKCCAAGWPLELKFGRKWANFTYKPNPSHY